MSQIDQTIELLQNISEKILLHFADATERTDYPKRNRRNIIGRTYVMLGHGEEWIVNKYDKRRRREVIIKRLYALDLEKKMWIAYCLLHNVQTLHATQMNSTANSLLNKGIVAGCSGSIMSLPFTIVDYVWLYLMQHRDVFLLQKIANNQDYLEEIEEFSRGLTRVY